MTGSDYAQIRQELEQMRQGAPRDTRKGPVFDFGLFILAYFFSLALAVTAMLALGLPLQRYTVLYAVPLAWLLLALVRKAPLYALMISVLGVLFLAAVSLLVSQVIDAAADSSSYYKANTGLMMYGWNPFQQTMTDFANSTRHLPYNSGWLPLQVDGQPKAAFMIGASFDAFTGNIACGKVFNIAGIAAAVCIIGPMIRDAFKVNGFAAFAVILLTAVNPVTLGQAPTFYSDGFAFQLLTVAAASLAYLAYRPRGRYAGAAKAAAFLAVCLAVNVKTSALLYSAVICLTYYIARVIAIARSGASAGTRRRRQLGMLLYFLSMAVAALGALGASTYVVNFLRYGNPLYGLLGSSSVSPQMEALMSPAVRSLPLFRQFFGSLFSPASGGAFAAVALKIPFTFSAAEFDLPSLDAVTGGWGIVFSGIFLVSLAVIIISLFVTVRRGSRRPILMLAAMLSVFLPVFFLPYLFTARNYLQLFWLPLVAMICLYSNAGNGERKRGRVVSRVLGILLCLALIFNCATAYHDLSAQLQVTKESRAAIAGIVDRTENRGNVMDVSPAARGLYYGLLFNLRDEGVTEYNFVEHILDGDITGTVFNFLRYRLRDKGDAATAGANAFLLSLNQNGYVVAIAKQGASGALTDEMLSLLNDLGLNAGGHSSMADNYIAVIAPDGRLLAEQSGGDIQTAVELVGGMPVRVQSTISGATIEIDYAERALKRAGYNIVVFDPGNMAVVDSVVINTENTPALSR